MEILSIGEKIKRARVYKGYTLNDLCYGKLSVSKMSCIENNKVRMDNDILEFIAKKLDLDKEYLIEDIDAQIMKNLSEVEGSVDFENEIKYNLGVAERYECVQSVFEILHTLFVYYIKENRNDKLQGILAKYYDASCKSGKEENFFIYNSDIGDFLFQNREFYQAATYYHEVWANTIEIKCSNVAVIDATIHEVKCYLMLKDYNNAFQIIEKVLSYEAEIKDKIKLAEIYHLVAILYLRNFKEDFETFEIRTIELNKGNFYKLAENKADYAEIYFSLGDNFKALECVKESIELFPKEDKLKLTKFMLKNIGMLIDNEHYKIADSFCVDVLNLAINLSDDKLIEKAYYYKSMLLCKDSNYTSEEMYINLSLDILSRFGRKQDIYKRYMEIGDMYKKMGAISDSLKYFSLAISLEKKI